MSQLAPSYYLKLLDKLQKCMCRTASPSLAASLEPLDHRRNLASLRLFCRFYCGRYSSELFIWFHFLILKGGLHIFQIDLMRFLSPFLDVTKTIMSTVSFIGQLDSTYTMLSFDV